MFLVLHLNLCGQSIPHGHSHGAGSHGHSHDEPSLNNSTAALVVDVNDDTLGDLTKMPKKSAKNINVRAAIIHVIGDFVQSIGVLCAAILIKFKVIPVVVEDKDLSR